MGGKNCAENIFDILWVNNSNNQYIQGDGLLVDNQVHNVILSYSSGYHYRLQKAAEKSCDKQKSVSMSNNRPCNTWSYNEESFDSTLARVKFDQFWII